MNSQRMENLTKKDFEMVSIDEKIFDKQFEGKPRSFLSDAMVRFSKNKVNLVAFIIVLLLILLAIFVPMFSKKDFTSPVVKNVQNLPPRVPLLEKIGIADGSVKIKDVPVDYTKIDEKTGLYLPLDESYNPQYIKSGTLTNKSEMSTDKNPLTLHGQNVIFLNEFSKATIQSKNIINILINSKIKINIKDISENTLLYIYLASSVDDINSENLIGTINSKGEFEYEISQSGEQYIYLVYENLDANIKSKQVEITDISILNSKNEVINYFEGYNLSQFSMQKIDNQGGKYERKNGEYVTASFKYFIYNKIFANVETYLQGTSSATEKGFSEYLEDYPELKEEFEPFLAQINENLPASGEKVINIDYTFKADGVPIRKVNSVIVRVNKFLNMTTYTYDVEMDGAFYNGFDSMPYFWFGTDKDGRDLFAEIWLSLRTSLFLGLIVSIINIVIGIIYGAIEGYYGGKVDFVMERIADYIGSFPGLTILTIIYLKYGPGLMLLIIYLTYSGWIGTASTTRIQFYRYRGREYVLASRSMGASDNRLIFKHILPNGIGIIITRSILSIPSMIFVESSLSFLGFGIGRGVTLDFGLFEMPGLSLGVLLYEGQQTMLIPGRFYQLLIPSVIIIILMISFNMFGNALRDAFNPTLRGNEK